MDSTSNSLILRFAFFSHQPDYLSTLPEEVQEAINEHADEFQTPQELREFAENELLRS